MRLVRRGCGLRRGGLLGRAALDGRRAVADLDLQLAGLALLGLGDADLEDALVERGGDRVAVDALGHRQGAAERAGGALEAGEALAALLVLGLALARQRQDVVLERQLDVVL